MDEDVKDILNDAINVYYVVRLHETLDTIAHRSPLYLTDEEQKFLRRDPEWFAGQVDYEPDIVGMARYLVHERTGYHGDYYSEGNWEARDENGVRQVKVQVSEDGSITLSEGQQRYRTSPVLFSSPLPVQTMTLRKTSRLGEAFDDYSPDEFGPQMGKIFAIEKRVDPVWNTRLQTLSLDELADIVPQPEGEESFEALVNGYAQSVVYVVDQQVFSIGSHEEDNHAVSGKDAGAAVASEKPDRLLLSGSPDEKKEVLDEGFKVWRDNNRPLLERSLGAQKAGALMDKWEQAVRAKLQSWVALPPVEITEDEKNELIAHLDGVEPYVDAWNALIDRKMAASVETAPEVGADTLRVHYADGTVATNDGKVMCADGTSDERQLTPEEREAMLRDAREAVDTWSTNNKDGIKSDVYVMPNMKKPDGMCKS